MKGNNNKEDINKILQRIEKQSSQQKKQKTMKILHRNEKVTTSMNIWLNMRKNISNNIQYWQRKVSSKHNHHIMILSIFAILSTYTCWMIQNKYDQMRRTANKTQTYKQRKIEKENQYINSMLNKKEFESVPIPNEIQQKYSYKYEQQERMQMQFDTKDDLLQAMKEQYQDGKIIDSVYEEELRSRKLI